MNTQINTDTNTTLWNRDVADTIQDTNVCSGCGKHCSLKNPSCGKGAALARERGITGHFDHKRTGREAGHWNHHRDSRHENYDFESCEDLDLLFRSCAHMVHHKDQRSGSREQILKYLMENGSVYQKDIQKELRIQPGSVSELLSKLEKHDLIVRKKSRLDKRAVIISLTEKGAAEMKVRMQEEADSPFDRLTDEEQEALRNILRKLLSSENRK